MGLQNVKHIVLVLSGKGGVGKSSITTQLALSLALQGHNVGILDVDLTGPSIPRFLGVEDSKIKQGAGGWQPVPIHVAQILQPSPLAAAQNQPESSTNGASESVAALSINGNAQGTKVGSLHAMSLAFLLASRSTAIVWRGPKKTAMIRQFLSTTDWAEGTDYLLVDTPPGTSDEHISLVETLLKEISSNGGSTDGINGAASSDRRGPNLAGAVVVTTPQAVATSDVRKELNFCAKTGVKVIGVVENMSGFVCPCCSEPANLFSKGGGQIMAAEFKVPFLGSVPVDPLWGILVEEGKRPVYDQEVASTIAAKANDDSDSEDEDEVEDPVDQPRIREEGLLVDKYRDCSLSPIFKDIADQVIDSSEKGTAVSVRNG